MLKYTINNLIELRLERNRTNLYVDNRLFIQCKHLILNIPLGEIDNLRDIKSIDDILWELNGSYEFSQYEVNLPPEIEFWGHCSNLQVWYENNYEPCLLHSSLAFPLLKKLSEAGDFQANRVFKEEVAKKFETGHLGTIQYLLYNDHLNLLNPIELECLFEQSSPILIENILSQLEKLIVSHLTNFKAIRELLDLILYLDLEFNKTFLIEISVKFPQKYKELFIKIALLHLNYKEFNRFKLSYGRFFNYFQQFITYLYENYPYFKDLLTLIDSGYYRSSYSQEEELTYGTALYK